MSNVDTILHTHDGERCEKHHSHPQPSSNPALVSLTNKAFDEKLCLCGQHDNVLTKIRRPEFCPVTLNGEQKTRDFGGARVGITVRDFQGNETVIGRRGPAY